MAASLGWRIDSAAAFGPVLESSEVEYVVVPHVLEHLAAEGGPAAGGAIENDGLVLCEILVVIRRLRISAKLEHAASDVDSARNLAALVDLGRIAHVHDERIALADHLTCPRRRYSRHRGIGGFQQLLDCSGHVILLFRRLREASYDAESGGSTVLNSARDTPCCAGASRPGSGPGFVNGVGTQETSHHVGFDGRRFGQCKSPWRDRGCCTIVGSARLRASSETALPGCVMPMTCFGRHSHVYPPEEQ